MSSAAGSFDTVVVGAEQPHPGIIHIALAGAACCNCMQVSDHLSRCAKCKRARYCNRDCQKQHYKQHKKECTLLEFFRNHYHENAGTFTLRQDEETGDGGTTRLLHEKILIGKAFRHEEVIRTLVATGQMRGPVDSETMDRVRRFIMWARVCAHCKKNEYEFLSENNDINNNNKGICCPTCKYGWCCSQEHYDAYMQTGHHSSELCRQFAHSATMETFSWQHKKRFNEAFAAAPDHQVTTRDYDPPFKRCPTGWEEYVKTRFVAEYAATLAGQLPSEFLPAATHLLSQSATCLYALFHHGLDEYTNKKGKGSSRAFTGKKTLTIHIVGACKNYEIPPRGEVWEELLHCLPAVDSLKTVFIGPEVGVDFPDGSSSSKRLCYENVECCPVCTVQNRTRSIEICESTYHEYKQDPIMFSQPDLIVVFNTGMYEECTESWKSSLQVMLDMNVPCLFTSYAKDEAVGDYAVLKSLNANCLSDETLLNPMRDGSPTVEPCPSMSTFQVNKYCIGFKGRRIQQK
jgi:mitochondrial splicing suppressor protein 51